MKRKLITLGITLTCVALAVWLTYGFALAGLPEINSLADAYTLLPQAAEITDRHGKFLEAKGTVIRTIPDKTLLSKDLQNSLLVTQNCLGLLSGQQKECKKLLGQKIAPTMRLAYKDITPGTIRYRLWSKVIARRLSALPPADLLALYANSLQFSQKIFGTRQAAWQFFGKSPTDLTLEQSLLLAALAQKPELDPVINNAQLQQEMVTIYQQLASNGTYKAELASSLVVPELSNIAWQRATMASTISDLALEQAKDDLSKHGRMVEQGLFVTTTIDLPLQQVAEDLLNEAIANQFITMGSIVVLDIANHQPLVMAEARLGGGGSIGNQIRAAYQPGSAIKPMLYLAALLENFTAASLINNNNKNHQEILDKLGDTPMNFRGEAPLRISLTANMPRSVLNLAQELDLADCAQLFTKMGLSAFKNSETITLEDIVGLKDISFLELVNSYAVLAQGGLHYPLRFYSTVSTKQSQVLESSQSTSKVVVNAVYSYIIAQMLKDELAIAPYNKEGDYFAPFSAKSGSSADGKNSYFIGFNGSVVVAVHVQPVINPAEQLGDQVSGHSYAGPLWSKMVHHLPDDFLGAPIVKPFGVNCVAVDPMSGARLAKAINNYYSCFKNGSEPTEDAPSSRMEIPPLPLD